MWAEKYKPKRLDEFAGNKTAVELAGKFDWKKPLLVYGPTGVGKSALVEALALEKDFEVVEVDNDNIDDALSVASTVSLYGRRRLVVIDNVGEVSDIKKVSSLLEGAPVPVVLTTADVKSKRLATLRKMCFELQLRRQQPATIASRLDSICKRENVRAERDALVEIAVKSGGDMRSAITDLETLAEGKASVTKKDVEGLYSRDTKGDVYKTLGVVFNGRDIREAVESTWDLDMEPRNTIFWIEENAPNLIQGKKQLSDAFHNISRADLFLKRAESRRYWGFWRYANTLMTAGVNASIERTLHAMYRFPSYFMAMSRSKAERTIAKAIGGKVGRKLHESVGTVVREYIPLLRVLLKNKRIDPDELRREYLLSEEEAGYLAES